MLRAWWNYWVAIGLMALSVPLPGLVARSETVPLRRPIAEFSVESGEWRGHDAYLSERAREVLGRPDILLRDYVDPQGNALGLYVAYFGKQERGELSHSPQNCLPGAGWQPLEKARVRYPLGPGTDALINEIVFEKAGRRQLVFYWFQERGRIVASEYWVKWYLIWDAITRHRTDGALIRIAAPIVDSEAATRERCLAFMRQVLPQVNDFLPS